ncbi:MAG: hypothetical protein GYB68_18930 [Chloroflexi bacterium]|nr:hypothetical protein [Chloroflexota bacterium]
MGPLLAAIYDRDIARSQSLAQQLGQQGIQAVQIDSLETHANAGLLRTFDAYYLAVDGLQIDTYGPLDLTGPMISTVLHRAPVVLITDKPIWDMLTASIRLNAWVDIPKTTIESNLLQRYATARGRAPRIIVDSDIVVYERLAMSWQRNFDHPLTLTDNVHDALEWSSHGAQTVFVNLEQVGLPGPIDMMTSLIYELSPIALATLLMLQDALPPPNHPIEQRFSILGPEHDREALQRSVRFVLNRVSATV